VSSTSCFVVDFVELTAFGSFEECDEGVSTNFIESD
jgi:hypothetical protein